MFQCRGIQVSEALSSEHSGGTHTIAAGEAAAGVGGRHQACSGREDLHKGVVIHGC
jgi:hypothetical protein